MGGFGVRVMFMLTTFPISTGFGVTCKRHLVERISLHICGVWQWEVFQAVVASVAVRDAGIIFCVDFYCCLVVGKTGVFAHVTRVSEGLDIPVLPFNEAILGHGLCYRCS